MAPGTLLSRPGSMPPSPCSPTLHDEDVAWVAVGLEEAVQQDHTAIRLTHAVQHPPGRQPPGAGRQAVGAGGCRGAMGGDGGELGPQQCTRRGAVSK